MTPKRKVRKDFGPSKEYIVDVSGCTKEEKEEVQQAFFDVGFPWVDDGNNYLHLNAAKYTNTTKDGFITSHCMYNLSSEGCNMTAKEFLELVYEPEEQGHSIEDIIIECTDMKELNDEIKLTVDLMQADTYERVLNELQHHLVCLLEMKRNELQKRFDGCSQPETPKPLTFTELNAGGWWCGDVSEACRLAFIANGLYTASDHWEKNPRIRCAYKLASNVPVLRAHEAIDVSVLKQITRIGGNFYWSEK